MDVHRTAGGAGNCKRGRGLIFFYNYGVAGGGGKEHSKISAGGTCAGFLLTFEAKRNGVILFWFKQRLKPVKEHLKTSSDRNAGFQLTFEAKGNGVILFLF